MEINIDELQKICLDFFRLAGMGFSLWDENRNNIFSYPQAHAPFCEAVRSDKQLSLKCAHSDTVGLDEVDRTKKPYVYTCHMGLTEAVVPILQNGEIAGYLMMGQIVEEDKRHIIEERIKTVAASPEFYQRLCQKIGENITTNGEKIHYCINILKVMIDYMNLSYVFGKSNATVCTKTKKYISENMSRPVLPKDICKAVGVSSNTLYKAIRKNEGMSPTELIREMKVDEAKMLLVKSADSISAVAEKVGIPDVNYFIRVFRRETGMSPLRYRKNESEIKH